MGIWMRGLVRHSISYEVRRGHMPPPHLPQLRTQIASSAVALIAADEGSSARIAPVSVVEDDALFAGRRCALATVAKIIAQPALSSLAVAGARGLPAASSCDSSGNSSSSSCIAGLIAHCHERVSVARSGTSRTIARTSRCPRENVKKGHTILANKSEGACSFPELNLSSSVAGQKKLET